MRYDRRLYMICNGGGILMFCKSIDDVMGELWKYGPVSLGELLRITEGEEVHLRSGLYVKLTD